MRDLWYRFFHAFCQRVYFSRVTVRHAGRLPQAGPVLYLGLHRNGAVDGFLFHNLLPRAVFLISSQLRRNPLGRLFFTGIEVARDKDRERTGEEANGHDALDACLAHLHAGGELFIFPEGTSSLGPRHLPFKSGAARLLNAWIQAGRPITVIPLGIHYECAWAFRSRAEIVVGEPIDTALPEGLTPTTRLRELRRRLTAALEGVGINVDSPQTQEHLECMGTVSTLATERSRFSTMKQLELSLPQPVSERWRQLEPELNSHPLWYHQGVPLFPMHSLALYALLLVVMAPVVAAGLLANLPPLLAAAWAGRKFPEDRNVIALWHILVGMPLFLLWLAGVTAACLLTGHIVWWLAYALLTALALGLYYRVHKLAVAVHNGLLFPRLRPQLLAFRETLLAQLPAEPAAL